MAKIAFIGLGHMGAPMVRNLLKHEHGVKVFDLNAAAVNALVTAGAKAATTLADCCADSEVIITMLPAGEHVHDVCTRADGLFKHAKANTLLIDSSSIAVDTARLLAKQAQEMNLPMLDAPVSGGVAGAEAATLTFMVGGTDAAFERAKPILAAMGKTIVHTGPSGTGQAAKICNNMILGVSMIAVSEAFTLAKKLGLDPQKLFEVSSNSSGQCWSMTSYCPEPGLVPKAPANRNYEAGFTTAMMLKDLRLSQTAAQSVGVTTPLGAEATALYTLFNNLGNAQLDFSGIIKMIAGDLK
jgi:3-hydroxyisobutyrate dehydrogenase